MPQQWRMLAAGRFPRGTNVLLWTRTGWDWAAFGTTRERVVDHQLATLERARRAGIPTVGFHLDRWWGLDREHQVADEVFFKVQLLATADGGHDDEWKQAGVEHVWMPPAVSRAEAELGVPTARFRSEIAFVGNWQGGYHPEWQHRAEFVAWLRDTYGDRARFWPQPGQPAVRGQALRDLYASVDVLVGDSCLVGGRSRYTSDRVPETLGRGGYLIHPDVEGVTDGTLYESGVHLDTWPVGDWTALRGMIDAALADPETRRKTAERGREHVLARHTYEIRMQELVAVMTERGMLG